jgi:CRISPR-associated protein Cas1
MVLRKYGLRPLDFHAFQIEEGESLESIRKRLTVFESRNAKLYFTQVFSLFPESLGPEKRVGFKAYDGLNNVFNFGYYVLKCRVHKALLKAKLEPYLGFLHTVQVGKSSLVCDFQELYRYLVEDFVIQFCRTLQKKDFIMKNEDFSKDRKGKREYLNDSLKHILIKSLNNYFQTKIEIPRIRVGKKQEIETLINEEALLLAAYLRDERKEWVPRVGIML